MVAAASAATVVADVDLNVQLAVRDVDGGAKRNGHVQRQPEPHECLRGTQGYSGVLRVAGGSPTTGSLDVHVLAKGY